MQQDRPLIELTNIGKTLEQRLNGIGVYTEQQLRTLGAIKAHQLIKIKQSDTTLPLCYYLYSFEGALRNLHWNKIGKKRKQRLKKELTHDTHIL